MISISPNIIRIIQSSKIDKKRLYLRENLDRNTYVAVNKILESIGLKWNRSEKCHIAEHDINELIDSILTNGEWVDEKKLNQFYATPASVISRMMALIKLPFDADLLILEPSAGEGAILEVLCNTFENSTVHYCEINEQRLQKCSKVVGENGLAIGNDFMSLEFHCQYDLIVMNPPFSKQQDIIHVSKALDILKPGGILISVMPEGTFFRENRKTVAFWKKVYECQDVDIIQLPENSFKTSGTMVRTRILWVKK